MVEGRRQPRALVSVRLKARERQRRLQMSMRKPLKVVMLGRAASGAVSNAILWLARIEQSPDSVGREGERKIRR